MTPLAYGNEPTIIQTGTLGRFDMYIPPLNVSPIHEMNNGVSGQYDQSNRYDAQGNTQQKF